MLNYQRVKMDKLWQTSIMTLQASISLLHFDSRQTQRTQRLALGPWALQTKLLPFLFQIWWIGFNLSCTEKLNLLAGSLTCKTMNIKCGQSGNCICGIPSANMALMNTQKTSKNTKRHQWLQRLRWVLLTHHLQACCVWLLLHPQ